MLQRFQLLGMGHCVANWRHETHTAHIVQEKAALRQELASSHHNTAAREQELKLEGARMQKDMRSTTEESAMMEQKLKEAELRWEEADAMVRALEKRVRESGVTTGDAQAEVLTLQGELKDLQASTDPAPPSPRAHTGC